MNSQLSANEPHPSDSYGEIGQLLSAERIRLRLSIEQASQMLHIRTRYLEALEEGRLHELPGLTYTRGYLQSYAAFLGLDKDEILRRFEEMEAVLGRKNFYFPQVFSKDKSPNSWMIWGSLGAAMFVYAVWSVLLSPLPMRLSQVEKMPPADTRAIISVETLRDVACLRTLDVLYPPCTMAKKPFFSIIPLRSQGVSIVELAQPEVL